MTITVVQGVCYRGYKESGRTIGSIASLRLQLVMTS
jgi:hypothetical protein